MKKLNIALFALSLSSLLAASAPAMIIQDANFRDTDLLQYQLGPNNPGATGVFDLVNDDGDGRDLLGFNPASHTVVDAMVGFVFAAYDGDVPFLLTRAAFQLGDVLQGWTGFEFVNGSGFEHGYTISFDSDGLTGDILIDIQEDGLLNWQVELDEGDFGQGTPVVLWGVYLGVVAEANAVPDAGSTAALFGLSVLAMAGFSKRRRRSTAPSIG